MAISSGEKKKEFEEALAGDLQGILTKIEEAHGEIVQLEEIARGINGLSSMLMKQIRALELMESEFKAEIKDVPNKIAGTKAKKIPMNERTTEPVHAE